MEQHFGFEEKRYLKTICVVYVHFLNAETKTEALSTTIAGIARKDLEFLNIDI